MPNNKNANPEVKWINVINEEGNAEYGAIVYGEGTLQQIYLDSKLQFNPLKDDLTINGLLSFEERMGCGFGACMGCSCKTKYGNKRICKDGPVLEKEEIIW